MLRREIILRSFVNRARVGSHSAVNSGAVTIKSISYVHETATAL